MKPLGTLRTLIAGAGLLGCLAGPLHAAIPTFKLTIDKGLHDEVEVGLAPVQGKGDNAVIKIFEGPQQMDVDITRVLAYGRNMESTLHSGTFHLDFSGFTAYCKPKLFLKIDDGSTAPPKVSFTAKGNITSSKVTLRDFSYEGTAAQDHFLFNSDGSISVLK